MCCGGNASKSKKRRIDSIVRKAERVISECQPSLDSVYLDLLRGKLEIVCTVTESADSTM